MINAIQQVGLGVMDKEAALDWFATVLGFRTVVFNDQGDAPFMLRYTGGEVCRRDLALVLNSHGGAGLEIWQHLSRVPLPQPADMSLRSTGFLICKLRCKGIETIVKRLRQDSESSLQVLGDITERPTGERCCYFSVFGSWFQLVEDRRSFFVDDGPSFCAGVLGVVVGVRDMDASLKFYRKILGYSHVIQDVDNKDEGDWPDWRGFSVLNKANSGRFRRVVLQRERPETGLYGQFFGVGEIELIEVLQTPLKEFQQSMREGLHLTKAPHLYADRYWGDPGFIHLCFDVSCMTKLAEELGCEFTVDTKDSFSIGQIANGRFAYLEEPDGSLIEFVETYNIPIVKKWGIGLKVKGWQRPLPRWLLRLATKNNYKRA